MIPRFKSRRFKALRSCRAKLKKDLHIEGSYVFIPELKLSIKVTPDRSLEQWLEQYCRSHPEKREELIKNYNLA